MMIASRELPSTKSSLDFVGYSLQHKRNLEHISDPPDLQHLPGN